MCARQFASARRSRASTLTNKPTVGIKHVDDGVVVDVHLARRHFATARAKLRCKQRRFANGNGGRLASHRWLRNGGKRGRAGVGRASLGGKCCLLLRGGQQRIGAGNGQRRQISLTRQNVNCGFVSPHQVFQIRVVGVFFDQLIQLGHVSAFVFDAKAPHKGQPRRNHFALRLRQVLAGLQRGGLRVAQRGVFLHPIGAGQRGDFWNLGVQLVDVHAAFRLEVFGAL